MRQNIKYFFNSYIFQSYLLNQWIITNFFCFCQLIFQIKQLDSTMNTGNTMRLVTSKKLINFIVGCSIVENEELVIDEGDFVCWY